MKNYIKKRIDNIKNDKLLKYGLIISVVLLICHIWQFYDSGYQYQPLIRVCFYSLMLPGIFFFGREAIFTLFLLCTYLVTLTISFYNYSPFVVLTLYLMIKSKSSKVKDNLKLWIPLLSLYAADVCVVCQLHFKHSSHLVIHFTNCFIIFFIMWHFVKNKKNIKPLVLDKDQERILHDLAKGKMQKEIDYFSKNTISDKIKDAVDKNNLLTKEQLLMRYMIINSEFN